MKPNYSLGTFYNPKSNAPLQLSTLATISAESWEELNKTGWDKSQPCALVIIYQCFLQFKIFYWKREDNSVVEFKQSVLSESWQLDGNIRAE